MSSKFLNAISQKNLADQLFAQSLGKRQTTYRWFSMIVLPAILFFFYGNTALAAAEEGISSLRKGQTTDLYPIATVQSDLVSLRSGPGQDYPVLTLVPNHAQFTVSGYSMDGVWVQICCYNGAVGWVDAAQVLITRAEPTAPIADPTPLPSPTPTPIVFYSWKTSYFANMELAGEPRYVEDLTALNLDWRNGAPHPSLPADGFSVRFERTLDLPSGYYRFQLQADDGVRFLINETVVLNEWHGATGNLYTVERMLAGVTTLRIEYFEGNGDALLRFNYEFVGSSQDWEAAYFMGQDLHTNPWLVQAEPRIGNYPLERRQPLGVASDALSWSARWRGQFPFDGGDYLFHARAQGGVRVYLNDYLILDGWSSGSKEIANTFRRVGRETHTIVIEYYSDPGGSAVQVWWERQ